eukprot:13482006-Alexandrium_andersonii.AAC.1
MDAAAARDAGADFQPKMFKALSQLARSAGRLAQDVTAVITGAAVSDAKLEAMLGHSRDDLPSCPCCA